MFRILGVVSVKSVSFPRIRGDVPFMDVTPVGSPEFSPHTRGCSVFVHIIWTA